MSQIQRTACVSEVGRLSNQDFVALMADIARHEEGSAQRLVRAVAPLLIAFFGGQVQAGRARPEDLEPLLHRALAALYRGRAGDELEHRSFRAWLLEVARSSMHRHGAAQCDGSVDVASVGRRPDDGDRAQAAEVATHFDASPLKLFATVA